MNNLTFLDILTILSFVVGVENLELNTKQVENLEPSDRQLLMLDEKAADIYNLLCGRDLYAASDRVRTPYIK